MGKIVDFDIQKNSEVFRPGETVCGRVTLTVEGSMSIYRVHIFCCGMALTKWSPSFLEAGIMSKEIYIAQYNRKAVRRLSTGQHDFYFSFQLPVEGLPSSYEGPYGSIRYFLKVIVEKPLPGVDRYYYHAFSVLAHLDANLPHFQVMVKVPSMSPVVPPWPTVAADASVKTEAHTFIEGTVYLSASIDRNGYCPGEKILINLCAKNESLKDCGAIRASLVQEVYVRAFTDRRYYTTTIKTLQDTPLERGASRIWNQQALQIDPIPPSNKELTCNIIKVTYHLKISVQVPMGSDLEIAFPLTICTVPLGMTVASRPTLARTGVYRVVGSNAVNYKQCTTGFERFFNSHGYFVNIDYVPMTAFVSEDTPTSSLTQTSHTAAVTSNVSPSAPPLQREHGPVAGHPSAACDESPLLPTYDESIQTA